MTTIRRTPALLLATFLLTGSVDAHGGATPTQRCVASKRVLVGARLVALTRCDASAAKKGAAPDAACKDAARTAFDTEWAVLESSLPPDSCVGTGDATVLGDLVDAEHTDLETMLVVTGTASPCTARKFKAAGKGAACALRCAYRTALDGQPLTDPALAACRSRCGEKLQARIGKAEQGATARCRTTGDAATVTAELDTFVDEVLALMPPPVAFCDRPGAVRFTSAGKNVVPGGNPAWPSLDFLHLPDGFCAHYFATVPNARQVRFAPGGELFVASPSRGTTGGGPGGQAAIKVIADDDLDAVGDAAVTFRGSLPATQGLLFANGYLYYQDDIDIRRVPYAAGDRSPSGPSELVASIDHYSSSLHWPKSLDLADDGTLYVSNGGDQGEACVQPPPFRGGILKLDSPSGTPVTGGMRNPIVVRCARGHNRCFALELSKDFSTASGGREKLVPIRDGDDWGFPCCATKDLPYTEVMPVPDCSAVAPESASFVIGDTPFGLDFAPASWPAPYAGSAFVSQHGAYGDWAGASMVTIPMDAATGLPETGGAMSDFATGWDDGTLAHGRPADLTFSPDGRLFLANDSNGVILWIAPMD